MRYPHIYNLPDTTFVNNFLLPIFIVFINLYLYFSASFYQCSPAFLFYVCPSVPPVPVAFYPSYPPPSPFPHLNGFRYAVTEGTEFNLVTLQFQHLVKLLSQLPREEGTSSRGKQLCCLRQAGGRCEWHWVGDQWLTTEMSRTGVTGHQEVLATVQKIWFVACTAKHITCDKASSCTGKLTGNNINKGFIAAALNHSHVRYFEAIFRQAEIQRRALRRKMY